MSEGSRIERIEREIGEIKSALGKLDNIEKVIEDLKRGLMDLRATLSEVENPFNLLKLITSEEDLAKINEAKPVLEKIVVKEKAPEASTENTEAARSASEERGREETYTKPISHTKEISATHTGEPPPRLEFKRIVELIEWIYTMLDLGFDEDCIRSICQCSEFLSLVPKDFAQHITSLFSAVKRSRSNNISEDTFILSIYSLASITGLAPNNWNAADLVKIFLKSKRLNGACNRSWGSQ